MSSFWLMTVLGVIDAAAFVAFLAEGKPVTAYIWISYASAQIGWALVALGKI